jgi:hypothetical protein
MAQIRYHNFRRGIISIDENTRMIGLATPGRMAGFDTFTSDELDFAIEHGPSAINHVDGGLTLTPNVGALMTPQGSIIKETAAIPNLSCDTNEGNSNNRVDLVIVTHEHVSVAGGAAAVYSVVKGSLVSFAIPALPIPEKQAILGYIIIPAGATSLDEAQYIPAPTFKDAPTGIVQMYSGDVNNIPVGYKLCDGVGYKSNLEVVPDMRKMFVVGYDPDDTDYDEIGKTGPADGDWAYNGPFLAINDYKLVDGGKQVRFGALSTPWHRHHSGLIHTAIAEAGMLIRLNINGITTDQLRAGPPDYSTNYTGNIADTGSSVGQYVAIQNSGPALTTADGTEQISPRAAVENRPPYYTLAYIVKL